MAQGPTKHANMILHIEARPSSTLVGAEGVEPPPLPCKSSALPLSYAPARARAIGRYRSCLLTSRLPGFNQKSWRRHLNYTPGQDGGPVKISLTLLEIGLIPGPFVRDHPRPTTCGILRLRNHALLVEHIPAAAGGATMTRVFGRYVPVEMAILALIESLVSFTILWGAMSAASQWPFLLGRVRYPSRKPRRLARAHNRCLRCHNRPLPAGGLSRPPPPYPQRVGCRRSGLPRPP